ncbi:hypothetical protein HK098_007125 [Nowakowskiella sp. JEL0407]|nr:hypothetical protein HK098_007125 [Nowakowskiella sp. JEL0407]
MEEYDVMISYCWKDKQSAKNLRDALKQLEISVWFDEDNMSSYVDEAMAKGIKSSKIFIPCLSIGYDNSVNCMKEFKFAAAINKKLIAVRLEEGDRCDIVEFNVKPTFWCMYVGGSEEQLRTTVKYIAEQLRGKAALPTQLQFGTVEKIRPAQLIGTSDFLDGINSSYFCWRWITRDGGSFRVVTLEFKKDDDKTATVCDKPPTVGPHNLVTVSNWDGGLGAVVFCWRWYVRPNGGDRHRVVTLENSGDSRLYNKDGKIYGPLSFEGINSYESGLNDGMVFGWRNYNRIGVNYRFLTIENA